MCICIWIWICICICICICIRMHMCIYICKYIYICMYVCAYISYTVYIYIVYTYSNAHDKMGMAMSRHLFGAATIHMLTLAGRIAQDMEPSWLTNHSLHYNNPQKEREIYNLFEKGNIYGKHHLSWKQCFYLLGWACCNLPMSGGHVSLCPSRGLPDHSKARSAVMQSQIRNWWNCVSFMGYYI